MSDRAPNLLTLLSWSQRLAAGEDCAELATWREASPDAAWQWPRIALATEMLDAGLASSEQLDLTSEEVAAWLDGGLGDADVAAATQGCWQSPAQLAELASAVRFRDEGTLLADASANLTQRLLELGPRPAVWRLDGRIALPVAAPLAPPIVKPAALPAVQVTRPAPQPQIEWPLWLLASAAAVLIIVLGGLIGRLAFLTPPRGVHQQPVAEAPDRPAAAPSPPPAPAPPRREIPREPAPAPRLPAPNEESPSIEKPPAPASAPQPSPPAPQRPGPAIPPRRLPPPPPPILAFRPALGALLVQDGVNAWRVAEGERPLNGPMRIVSLADSWSTVEVPGVGTLICEGPAAGQLSPRAGGGLEIVLTHGRLAVQDLAAGKEIRFQAGGASWTARGVDHYSTLAVLADPAAPQVLVPAGAVAVDQFNVAAQQRVLWQQGLLQAPQPIAASPAAMNAAPAIPVLGDPLDLAWLKPPDAERRKQFQTLYGKLVERLAAADDASGELTKLLEASKDARTAALLSRWNAALADDATRAEQTWTMLADRRVFVRLAGVRTLLELPPGDLRLVHFGRLLRRNVGDAVADRVLAWLSDVRQPTPLPGAKAVELVDFLTHSELGLRQLAVSLLELHAAAGLARAGMQPPVYDAAGSPPRRTAGQLEWRRNLRQIFAPAKNVPAALAPAPAAAGS